MTKEERRENDKMMILGLHKTPWTHWPFLPVKKSDWNTNYKSMGIIYCKLPRKVMLINLWEMSPETIEKAEIVEYESVDAMLDDGWVVD